MYLISWCLLKWGGKVESEHKGRCPVLSASNTAFDAVLTKHALCEELAAVIRSFGSGDHGEFDKMDSVLTRPMLDQARIRERLPPGTIVQQELRINGRPPGGSVNPVAHWLVLLLV